nr:K108 [uncultured bacterium]
MRLRSLRALTLAYLAVFLLVTTLTGMGIFAAGRATISNLVDQRIASETSALIAGNPGHDRTQFLRQMRALVQDRDTADLGIMLTQADGRPVGGNIHLKRPLPLGYSTLGPADGIEGLTQGRALVRDLGGGLRLTIVAETEPVDHYNAARARIYLIGFGSIIALVMGATLLFARTVRRRIVEMRQAVEAIIDGDLRRRLPVERTDSAFDQQALAFNHMLDRIGELMDQISSVSNDIAHEMRTPLARLHQRLKLLMGRPEVLPIRDDLNDVMADANQLLAMFAAMLRIAEVEGGARRAGFAPVALGALCIETAAMMEPVSAESGHRLVAERCDDLQIFGDRQLLSQMLLNLVENGLRHAPPGSWVRITLQRRGDRAVLEVSDNGPGIAAEAREHVLTRFGRLGPTGARAGHGLGLPLVDAIVRLHRGAMTLEDASPGLRIVIALPLA